MFCPFCMHDWHRAVVLFSEHLITIGTTRLTKMFFYLIKECSLGWVWFFFPCITFPYCFGKRLSFVRCLFNFSLKPSGLCILHVWFLSSLNYNWATNCHGSSLQTPNRRFLGTPVLLIDFNLVVDGICQSKEVYYRLHAFLLLFFPFHHQN